METIESWNLLGANQQVIYGNTHIPNNQPLANVILCHGFKGYKDYGFIPVMAKMLSGHNFVVHRFNFSHSAMLDGHGAFERLDLFEQDTWNKQVYDLLSVIAYIFQNRIQGKGLPIFIAGHSRGGVTCLLTAGRLYSGTLKNSLLNIQENLDFSQMLSALKGVITIASPDTCNPYNENQKKELLEKGYLESPSSRTSQTLKVGKAFLEEQLFDKDNHDLLNLVKQIKCPITIFHGDSDPTVSTEAAHNINQANKSHSFLHFIHDANHVFNTKNPFTDDDQISPQLETLVNECLIFLKKV